MKNDVKNLESQVETLKNSKDKKEDWKVLLKTQLKTSEDQLKRVEESKLNNDSNGDDASYKEELKQQIEEKKYLLAHNIKPMEQGDISGNSYIFTIFEVLGMIFLPAGVTLFTADMVSGEFTPPTMKFLITQPISRGKLLFSKFIAAASASVVSIVSLELIAYGIMGAIFGFGNANYPIYVGTRYKFDLTKIVNNAHPLVKIPGSTTMTTAGSYITNQFLLQILLIIACVAFAFMLSSIMKSSMVSVSTSIFLTILFTLFTQIRPLIKFSPFVFTTYGNSTALVKGTLSRQLQIPSLTVSYGIVVLLIWIIVPYVISHIVFTKKDILI